MQDSYDTKLFVLFLVRLTRFVFSLEYQNAHGSHSIYTSLNVIYIFFANIVIWSNDF